MTKPAVSICSRCGGELPQGSTVPRRAGDAHRRVKREAKLGIVIDLAMTAISAAVSQAILMFEPTPAQPEFCKSDVNYADFMQDGGKLDRHAERSSAFHQRGDLE